MKIDTHREPTFTLQLTTREMQVLEHALYIAQTSDEDAADPIREEARALEGQLTAAISIADQPVLSGDTGLPIE